MTNVIANRAMMMMRTNSPSAELPKMAYDGSGCFATPTTAATRASATMSSHVIPVSYARRARRRFFGLEPVPQHSRSFDAGSCRFRHAQILKTSATLKRPGPFKPSPPPMLLARSLPLIDGRVGGRRLRGHGFTYIFDDVSSIYAFRCRKPPMRAAVVGLRYLGRWPTAMTRRADTASFAYALSEAACLSRIIYAQQRTRAKLVALPMRYFNEAGLPRPHHA